MWETLRKRRNVKDVKNKQKDRVNKGGSCFQTTKVWKEQIEGQTQREYSNESYKTV